VFAFFKIELNKRNEDMYKKSFSNLKVCYLCNHLTLCRNNELHQKKTVEFALKKVILVLKVIKNAHKLFFKI
jgi:hypothetical protein